MATSVWTTVSPIPWRNTSFVYLPYWVFDVIVSEHSQGRDWRDWFQSYQPQFDILRSAYAAYTDIDFIESRNGYLHKMSDFTPAAPVVTITAKAAATTLKIGDPDLDATAMFDITPSGTAVVLTTLDATKASIVSNKAHGVGAGSTVITATAGSVSAQKAITITA